MPLPTRNTTLPSVLSLDAAWDPDAETFSSVTAPETILLAVAVTLLLDLTPHSPTQWESVNWSSDGTALATG